MDAWRRKIMPFLASGFLMLAFAVGAAAQSPQPENSAQSIQSDIVHPGCFTASGARPCYTIGETIGQSIFGKPDAARPWTPLAAWTFFSEGWREPWIAPPNGPGGSLRQGWIGVPEAFFNRQVVGIYSNMRGANGAQHEQVGAFLVESPLSRRYDLAVLVPFVDNLHGAGRTEATSFGDMFIGNRWLLHETADLSVSLNLNVRVPTGPTWTGNGRTVLTPYLAFYKDLWGGVSVRGAVGAEVPVGDEPSRLTTTLTQSLAVGQTITPHDTPLLGDFTYYVCANVREDLNTGKNPFLSFTPGIRTHLGREWFLLAGVEIPVTSNRGFYERFTVLLVKGF